MPSTSVFFPRFAGACALVFALLGPLAMAPAQAVGLADLTSKESAAGLKEALSRGAELAVGQLGKRDGFLGDSRVKIPLPDGLRQVEGGMRAFGMGKQADELVETMNRAAESAVTEAKPILLNAVKSMSFDDAKGILAGGDDAATQYFRKTTATPIGSSLFFVAAKCSSSTGLSN